MALEFLNQTPEGAFRRLRKELKTVDSSIDMSRYIAMTPRRLSEEIDRLDDEARRNVMESNYGSWLTDRNYVRNKLLREGLEFLIQYKQEKIAEETMVPGFTYYRGVKQFGNKLIGRKCHYLEEGRATDWVPFKQEVAVAKAMEILRHGDENDFKRVYVEMADGRLDALNEVALEHITESSKDALRQIEEYCDQRWDGEWPWEVSAPQSLRIKIEEKREIRMNKITEMQGRFARLLDTLREGEMEQYEIVNMARDMMSQVDNMIGDLGKISSSGIEATAGARSMMGDEAAQSLEHALGEPVQEAAQALSSLKAAVQQAIQSLEGGAGGGGMGGDLGTPGDAMGDKPIGGGDMSDELADVNMDGTDGERPMKDL